MQIGGTVKVIRLHEGIGEIVHHLRGCIWVFGIDLGKRIAIQERGVSMGRVIDQKVLGADRELAPHLSL